jgi:fructose-1,6-bisphosphatase/inositol monophosphatase family enzyme
MEEYLAFATDLANQAGEIMLRYFRIGVKAKTKSNNTPVTEADEIINRLVIEAVQKTYPTHAVLGEEQSLDVTGAPYVWVCDPIDGTFPFAQGVPTNVFALALVDAKDGLPVVAVVLDPYTQRLYTAIKGQGVFVNGQPIRVNAEHSLRDATIDVSSRRSKVFDFMGYREDLQRATLRQSNYLSTIYGSCLVAAGQLTAEIYVGFGAHDVAAAKLLVEEAGGKVTDMLGNEQRYDREVRGAIISNGLVHDKLVALSKRHVTKV